MKRKMLIGLMVLHALALSAQVGDYFTSVQRFGVTDYQMEQSLMRRMGGHALMDSAWAYCSDTLLTVRQTAYHLIHQAGKSMDDSGQREVVHRLLQGASDSNGGLAGQSLMWLSYYGRGAYDADARRTLQGLLVRKQQPHYRRLLLLAGYVGAGNEEMQRKLLLPERETAENLWTLHLAQSRMGNVSSVSHCLDRAKRVPVCDAMVNGLVPDLIYTRQRELLDYCVSILGLEEPLCTSLNPDRPERILCGYRVLELLAPVIEAFPIRVDATGSLVTSDYVEALKQARAWFQTHPDYGIINEGY